MRNEEISLHDKISVVLHSHTNEFVALSKTAGLDPQRHFRWSDFSEVDFSGSDLSGFDFSGSDLSGCTFTGAQIANATFRDAIVSLDALSNAADWSDDLLASLLKSGFINPNIAIQTWPDFGGTPKYVRSYVTQAGTIQIVALTAGGLIQIYDSSGGNRRIGGVKGHQPLNCGIQGIECVTTKEWKPFVIAWCYDGFVRGWSTEDLVLLFEIKTGLKAITGASFYVDRNKNPKVLAWGGRTFRIWCARTSALEYSDRSQRARVYECRHLSSKDFDGRTVDRIALRSANDTVHLIDTNYSNPIGVYRHPGSIMGMRAGTNAKGHSLLATWTLQGVLRVWAPGDAGRASLIWNSNAGIIGAEFIRSDDGRCILVVWMSNGHLALFDMVTMTIILERQLHEHSIDDVIVISDHSKVTRLLTYTNEDCVARLCDIEKDPWEEVELRHSYPVRKFVRLQSGQFLSLDASGKVYLWSESGIQQPDRQYTPQVIRDIFALPDGTVFVVAPNGDASIYALC